MQCPLLVHTVKPLVRWILGVSKVHRKLSRSCRYSLCLEQWTKGFFFRSVSKGWGWSSDGRAPEQNPECLAPHNPGNWEWKVRKSEVQAQIELYWKFEIGETLSKKTKITLKLELWVASILGSIDDLQIQHTYLNRDKPSKIIADGWCIWIKSLGLLPFVIYTMFSPQAFQWSQRGSLSAQFLSLYD